MMTSNPATTTAKIPQNKIPPWPGVNAALGVAPLAPLNEKSEVKTPPGVNWNTVPRLFDPPWDVVP